MFSDTEEIIDLKDLWHYTEEGMNTTNQEELITISEYCKAIILDVRGKWNLIFVSMCGKRILHIVQWKIIEIDQELHPSNWSTLNQSTNG